MCTAQSCFKLNIAFVAKVIGLAESLALVEDVKGMS